MEKLTIDSVLNDQIALLSEASKQAARYCNHDALAQLTMAMVAIHHEYRGY